MSEKNCSFLGKIFWEAKWSAENFRQFEKFSGESGRGQVVSEGKVRC